MKDEIKEILDFLEGIVNEKYAMPNEQELLNKKEIKILLDYITKLEEEKRIEQESLKTIQELEEKLYNLTHTIFTGRNYNEVLKSEQDYKSRNEKAVEYIKEHYVIDGPIKFKNDLLDILQGDDKE